MDLRTLSERDICTKVVIPALLGAGWTQSQFHEEVLTNGRVMVRGQLASRITNPDVKGGPKRADFVLYADGKIPLAVIEVKRSKFEVGDGMQQALHYAEMLDAPIAISTNGMAFLIHDRTGLREPVEQTIGAPLFPSFDELWSLYKGWKGIQSTEQAKVITQPYYTDSSGKKPYYYQQVAINRCIEAIAKGQNRLLLVMATGTGKTYTAFQIIWRLWKAKQKKRILFLADRNILVDQTILQDFAPFGEVMHKITNREVKKHYEIYLGLYQAVTGQDETRQIYRQFPSDFFDLVVIDECHRGSATDNSAWRDILDYFSAATHLGLTATPKERTVSDKDGNMLIEEPEFNYKYFGPPVYTYSLRQGIEDGFLAPYQVIRVVTDVDALGYTPEKGKVDLLGQVVEQRQYNTTDFDRELILTKRTELVAKRTWEFLQATNPMSKTIIFCDDQPHAERMRQALVNIIPAAASNRRYVMRITGDDKEGKAQLSYFIDNDEPFPVIATTSRLLSTGVDAKMCKLIVLDQTINSLTQFKQIVGRGTRIREDYGKLFFTIIDFKGATRLFQDPEFDGEPTVIHEPEPDDPILPPDPPEDPTQPAPEPEHPDAPDDLTDPEFPDSEFPDPDDPSPGTPTGEGRTRYYVDDPVNTAIERSLYLDEHGRLVSESYRVHLKEEIRRNLRAEFASMTEFLNRWSESERKQMVVESLLERGIDINILQQAVPKGASLDAFDLIAHIAFDQPPLSRKERANQVRKRNYFAKYNEDARAILDGLLDKFADHGITDIEDPKVLELPPFSKWGTKTHIRRNIFGGHEAWSRALTELEKALYEQDIA